MILKIFLNINTLNNPYLGGICSYGLLNLIIAVLKSYNLENSQNIPKILEQFLVHYS
jgi:DNA polymerase sigma